MKYLLLITFFCALVNSHARILTEKSNQLEPPSLATAKPIREAAYYRPSTPPPPAPKAWTSALVEILIIYGRGKGALLQLAVTGGGPSEEWDIGKEKKPRLPPPTPKEAPPTHQVSGGGTMVARENLGKDGGGQQPPSPHHAPPTHEVTSGEASAAFPSYGKEGDHVAPPAPHHAPPTHEVSGGGGVAGLANYGKEGGHVAPPSPHHAPPTHEVSGAGAPELERSTQYLLLSASA